MLYHHAFLSKCIAFFTSKIFTWISKTRLHQGVDLGGGGGGGGGGCACHNPLSLVIEH